jgi:hypothetical protein
MKQVPEFLKDIWDETFAWLNLKNTQIFWQVCKTSISDLIVFAHDQIEKKGDFRIKLKSVFNLKCKICISLIRIFVIYWALEIWGIFPPEWFSLSS